MKPADKEFYKKVLVLVLPMALQNLINVGVTATDVVMLGKVGEDVLSGSSLAGQVQWVMSLVFFGLASGASVLIAQYWGKKDIGTIEKIMGITLRCSLITGVIFTAAAWIFPVRIICLFTNEASVIREAAKYLRIVSCSYILISFTMMYLNVIKSVEKVIVSTVVYSVSLVFNIILNYILIFGKCGMPALGIEGAAAATLSARVLELVMVAVYAWKINKTVKFRVKNLFVRDKLLWGDFVKYATPVIFNELLWGAGYSANTAIMGHLGSSAVAANSVAHTIRQLSMVVSFGVGNATAIMMGKAIGEGREDVAEDYGRRFVNLSLVTGALGTVLILVIRPLVVHFMGFEAETSGLIRFFLLVMAFYVIGQSYNSTCIVGVFRSGGDTKFGLYIDIGCLWGGSILFGAVAAFVFHAPIRIVYLFIMSDEFIKMPLSYWRYRKKKWLNNVTR